MATIEAAVPELRPAHATVADDRWERRPRLAFLVRLIVFLAPAVVATDVSLVLTRLLPEPDGVLWSIVWWIVVLVVSGATLLLFDRLFRRLLPLTVLLGLALVFPGVAPSRFSTAFRAGTIRNLQRRIEQAKHDAAHADTIQAASTVVELIAALAIHDPKTRGHSERTRAYADLIAEELGLSANDRDHLRWAALLHDIGKLHVTAAVLNKPGRPDPAEWEVLRSHPVEGARLTGALRHWLGPWGLAIEQHHERFDGAGYPAGLAGHDISLGGRIVAVADAYEVMTSARTYTPPVHPADAREELVRCAGTHFDPDIVRAFLRIAVGRFPRRAGFLVLLAQVPGVVGVQQVFQQAGSVVAAGTAVASLAAGGIVVPGAPGLGGLEGLPLGRPSATAAPKAAAGRARATVPATAPPRPRFAAPGPDADASPSTTTGTELAASTTTAPDVAVPTPPRVVTAGYFLGGTTADQAATPAELVVSSPAVEELVDFDGDGEPGRTLSSSPRPATTTAPDEHQLWLVRPEGAVTITGTPTLRVSSAIVGFGSGRGTLQALLLDCDAAGEACLRTPITAATLSQADWSEGAAGFTPKSLTFGPADHTLAAGRTLVLRIGVPNRSAPLLVAYGSQEHAAFLAVEVLST